MGSMEIPKRRKVEVNEFNKNMEIHFKGARGKVWVLKNNESMQAYYRITELLSLSCLLVVIILKGQRRVFLTIQANLRQ